jgi:hypothetical protein
MSFNIESCRIRLGKFEESLNRQLYQFYSGRKSVLELVNLYSDYSDIFSLDSIREVETEYNSTSESFSSRRKSLRKIWSFLIDQHLDAQLAPLTEEIHQLEAQGSLVWEGRNLALSQVAFHLKNESDAFKRRNLSERYARELQKSELLRQESVSLLNSVAITLGFKHYAQAREQISGVDYHKLLESWDAALRPLEDKYMERLRASFEISQNFFQEAGAWDIAYWEKKNEAEHIFSKDNLIPIVKATLSDLGIEPERPDSVSIDMENQEGKRAGPLCIPIKIPHEIKIVMIPENGARQYFSLLHEIGHAYHFAWTNPSLALEHRIMGDGALSESYAFLLEHFLRDQEWLARMFSFVKSKEFLQFQTLSRLFLVRRCVGKLRFAVNLYECKTYEEMPGIYSETMKAYTGLAYRPEFWMHDLSDGFYSADHLRGWMCEAILREYLRTRFGNSWMMNRSAAGFLKEIWETGQLYRADELCKEIGMGDLDPQVLADEISEGLKF